MTPAEVHMYVEGFEYRLILRDQEWAHFTRLLLNVQISKKSKQIKESEDIQIFKAPKQEKKVVNIDERRAVMQNFKSWGKPKKAKALEESAKKGGE